MAAGCRLPQAGEEVRTSLAGRSLPSGVGRRTKWPFGLLSLGCALSLALAGCGQVHSKPHGSATHTIRMGDLSVRVPHSWRKGHQVTIAETPVTSGYDATLLPKTMPDSGPGIPSNPYNESPYFVETMQFSGGKAYLQLGELTSSGRYYTLNIQVPANQTSTLGKVAKTISVPPPATPTAVVKLMQKDAAAGGALSFTTAHVGAADRWILTGGNPATVQEPFALYHSTDGGRTWTLQRFTTFRGSDDFMGLEGSPAIFFWTPADGLIAESTGWSPQLLVYRTTDGGKTWTTIKVSSPGRPDGTEPTVAREPDGTLVITARVSAGQVFQVASHDGGKTWSPAG